MSTRNGTGWVKSALVSGQYFPPQTGGISRMMDRICHELGVNRVCCFTGVPASRGEIDGSGNVRVYRRPRAFDGGRLSKAVSLGYSIPEILLRERPQVLQLATCYDGRWGLWAKKWLGLSFVVYAHGNEVLGAVGSPCDVGLPTLKDAAYVLANSGYTARLVENAGVKAARIKVIPLGCDTVQFTPKVPSPEFRARVLGDRADSRVILTVGNLVARKGHDMIMRALPAVSRAVPDVIYLIVGSGPSMKDLENLASALGVHDRVLFAGQVPDETLSSYYGLCDVFAMPSRFRPDCCDVEGFGLVFLEAAACGKPSVGGRSGGIEDAIVDGTTGLLVDPCDAEDVGQALIRLLGSPDLKTKLGTQGRNRIEKAHTWRRVSECIQEILEQVVGKRLTAE